MNAIKYFAVLLLLTTLVNTYSQESNVIPDGVSVSDGKFTVTITPGTSKSEIDSMKKYLSGKGITLKITDLDYEDGRIKNISGKLNCEKSRCSFTSTDLKNSVIIKGSIDCNDDNLSVYIH